MNGLDLEWLMNLDLLSFDSLVGSLDREIARREKSAACLTRAAFGADQKGWKELMKALDKEADESIPDEQQFLDKFGGGI